MDTITSADSPFEGHPSGPALCRLDYAPGKFLLKNDTLICAVHGATFNQADGLCVAGPCRGEHLRAVAVRVDDGEIHLAQ